MMEKNACKLETKGREFAKILRSLEQFSKSETIRMPFGSIKYVIEM